MSHPSPEHLGPPSVRLGSFQLWIQGREFPKSHDEYDGNWLNVVAHCGAARADVWATGAILDTVGLSRFRDQLALLCRTLSGEAALYSPEPYVAVHVKPIHPGNGLRVEVHITPDPSTQSHRFEFEIDEDDVRATLEQLDSALAAFPVRGKRG